MSSRIHLLFAYTVLCLLSLNYVDAIDAVQWPKQKLKVESFSWQDCGPSSYPDHIKSLTVSPDPVKIPGNLTVAMSAIVGTASPTDVALAITVEKKVAGFWIKVPCVDKIGSCTYDDVCTTWATVCPKYFEKTGLPCTCPIPANTYTVSDVVLDVTEKLPPGSVGDIRVTTNFESKSAARDAGATFSNRWHAVEKVHRSVQSVTDWWGKPYDRFCTDYSNTSQKLKLPLASQDTIRKVSGRRHWRG